MEPRDVLRHWSSPSAELWVRAGLAEPSGGDWCQWLGDGEERLAALAAGNDSAGTGRGDARRVCLGGHAGVWRRNRHGGLFGGVLADRYLSAARLRREIAVSEELRDRGIPTPPVLLALAARRRFWRQHLVTEEVPGACTVFDARGEPSALAAAAVLLQQLFDAGLWAPDLHPGNLLWEPAARRCAVIDLAGARLLRRPLRPAERRSRLRRFARYFRKHGGSVPDPFRELSA